MVKTVITGLTVTTRTQEEADDFIEYILDWLGEHDLDTSHQFEYVFTDLSPREVRTISQRRYREKRKVEK